MVERAATGLLETIRGGGGRGGLVAAAGVVGNGRIAAVTVCGEAGLGVVE